MAIVVESDGPILAVDDDAIFRDVFEVIYQMSGLSNELLLFSSGEDCLDYCGQTDKTCNIPSMILMDVNMPGLGGFDTVKRIRQIEHYLEKQPPIIMLSSSTEPLDIAMSKKVGANDYMVKPIGLGELQFIRQ